MLAALFFFVATSRFYLKSGKLPNFANSDEDIDALLARAAELRREIQDAEASLPEQKPTTPQAAPPQKNKVDRSQIDSLTENDMLDEEFRDSVQRQVINAFDNIPTDESAELFNKIWRLGPSRTVDNLAKLAVQADEIERDFVTRRLDDPGVAGDAMRVIRSRIRMWAKDYLPEDESPRMPWEIWRRP